MRATTKVKYLDIKTVGEKNSKLLTAYDGANLVKVFLDDEQEMQLAGSTFGKELTLIIDVYLTKNNQMGTRLIEIIK